MDNKRSVLGARSELLASRISKKLDENMEKILMDSEDLVKQHFPARFVSASLTKLQKLLKAEGISCNFDKKITRSALRKTANLEVTDEQCDEALKVIAKAIVDETEDTLDKCNTAIESIASRRFEKAPKTAARKIKSHVEKKLSESGLAFKL